MMEIRMKSPLPRWLVLDLDGTLVDSVPDLAAALNRCLAGRGREPGLGPLGQDAVRAMVGDGVKALVERGFRACGAVADASDIARFLVDYEAHAAVETRPYPGVPETLRLLRAAGWHLAVCTNKPVGAARALLTGLDLAAFFTTVGGGDSYAVRKPDPGHLLATLAEAHGVAARAVMVGDHHNDIHAARGAGIACIWAAWGYGVDVTGADATAAHFADLPALLEQVLG